MTTQQKLVRHRLNGHYGFLLKAGPHFRRNVMFLVPKWAVEEKTHPWTCATPCLNCIFAMAKLVF